MTCTRPGSRTVGRLRGLPPSSGGRTQNTNTAMRCSGDGSLEASPRRHPSRMEPRRTGSSMTTGSGGEGR